MRPVQVVRELGETVEATDELGETNHHGDGHIAAWLPAGGEKQLRALVREAFRVIAAKDRKRGL